jgi:hypothetical protein
MRCFRARKEREMAQPARDKDDGLDIGKISNGFTRTCGKEAKAPQDETVPIVKELIQHAEDAQSTDRSVF